MNEKELLCRMALPLLPGIGLVGARHLIQAAGSATMLFEHARELPALLPGVTPKVATAFQHTEVFRLCEAELSFAQKHQIQCLTEDNEAYPSRLRECPDAPLVLFYKGSANLNSRHILSIVGTRNATDYGKSLCQRFMQELSALIPDVLMRPCAGVSPLQRGADVSLRQWAADVPLLRPLGAIQRHLPRLRRHHEARGHRHSEGGGGAPRSVPGYGGAADGRRHRRGPS